MDYPLVFLSLGSHEYGRQNLLRASLATPLLLYALFGWIPEGAVLVLGIVFSAVSLISQHERKAIKFLVLLCVDIVIYCIAEVSIASRF